MSEQAAQPRFPVESGCPDAFQYMHPAYIKNYGNWAYHDRPRPGVLHHVIIRGIERGKIFRDDKDRDDMIDRLGDLLPATHTECYAWAFFVKLRPFSF